MPRPLVLTDHLRELPADAPLDVGAARTATQALTAGQIAAGRNVSVAWEDGVLIISASGTGAPAGETVAERLSRLPTSGVLTNVAAVAGGGPSDRNSYFSVQPEIPPKRLAIDAGILPATTLGADFDWIMTTGGEGVNKHAFTAIGEDAGAWAGIWRTLGNWRGRWVYRHRDDATRLCFFDPETSAWTFAVWPAGTVFPDYPDGWNTRADRLFAVAAPGESEAPPESGYHGADDLPLSFSLDFDFIPLTGDEILVSGSGNSLLDGIWRATPDERYEERRYYRRASDGGGIIYYYASSGYGWLLYGYGSYPGDGPPDECSYANDESDPNHAYLAPASGGYRKFYDGNTTGTTIIVTA